MEKLYRNNASQDISQDILILSDQIGVIKTVNNALEREVDRLSQYTRRHTVVIRGIPTDKGETIKTVEERVKDLLESDMKMPEAVVDFDKCQRIGPKDGNKQSVIVRFKSHNARYSVYQNRKN